MNPSYTIRTALEAQLVSRFNTALATACNAMGVDPFSIVWTPGTNYWRAAFTIEDLRDKVSANKWPCITLATAAAAEQEEQSFITFDGSVTVALNIHYRWEDPAEADLETLPDAGEQAALECLYAVPGMRKATLSIERTPPEFFTDCWFVSQFFTSEYSVQQS